jgi:type VI secretion system protein VasG
MIDAILTNAMLPDISKEFLTRMMEGKEIERVSVTVTSQEFAYGFQPSLRLTAWSRRKR